MPKEKNANKVEKRAEKNEKKQGRPSSLRVRFPIHFCRARISSILPASSGEDWRDSNPGRSEPVEAVGSVGPAAAAGPAAVEVAAGGLTAVVDYSVEDPATSKWEELLVQVQYWVHLPCHKHAQSFNKPGSTWLST